MARETLQHIIELARAGSHPNSLAIVFDLDSTIFNVSGRTEAIMRQLSQERFLQEKYPEETRKLAHFRARKEDWGISEPLERLGLRATIKFFHEVQKYWIQHFFSNHFLHHDVPYPGAVEFVQKLHATGVPMYYLTGRQNTTMKEGTLESFKQWSLPDESDQVQLLMKPTESISDHEYKCREFSQLVSSHQSLWFFENEPVIIQAVRKQFEQVNIVYMDSVHSGRADPPTDVPMLSMEFNFG